MNLRTYLSFLRHSWEWVAVSTLIGIIAAMALVLSTTPRFAATSELFLATPGYSATGNLAASETSPYKADVFTQQRARSYVQLASHVDLAARVIDKLGLKMRPQDLANDTSAAARPDTVLINVTVTSASPGEARVLADAMTAELANEIRRLETPSSVVIPTVEPVITQRASTPSKPSEPNVGLYLTVGASVGFLVGVTTAAWLRRRRAVVGAAMVEQATDRPVLGLAGEAHQRSEPLTKEWRKIYRNVAFEMEDTHDQVIAVTNVAGSNDASAVAFSLAAALARHGSRTALIAVETHGQDSRDHPVADEHSAAGLAAAVIGETRLEDAVRPTEVTNLYYLAGRGPGNPTHVLRSERFRHTVAELRRSFDAVIFDAPGFLRLAETTILSEIVDSVVLVVTDKATRMQDLSAAVRLLEERDARLMGTILTSISGGDDIKQENDLLASGRGLG